VSFARYNLGTWLLTLMVVAVWLEHEGLGLVCRGAPGVCRAWSDNGAVRKLAHMVEMWTARFGLADAEQECGWTARKPA
jgi:hypothetical protein